MHAIKEKLLRMGLLCLLAILTGAITGVITAGFGRILLEIGTLRTAHLLWFLPFLPLAGALMVWVYQKYGKESSQGMGLIFDAATGKADRIPLRLIPLLIGSTWLTHLCGGSAGREGVAVQLGATVAHWTGNHIPQFQKQKSLIRILTISGMAAYFTLRLPLFVLHWKFWSLASWNIGHCCQQHFPPSRLISFRLHWVWKHFR